MNLGFGDLSSNDSVSDTVNPNNGDIEKILATVIAIIKEFTAEYPQVLIFSQDVCTFADWKALMKMER